MAEFAQAVRREVISWVVLAFLGVTSSPLPRLLSFKDEGLNHELQDPATGDR